MENVLVSIARQLVGIHNEELEGAEHNILALLEKAGVVEEQEADVNGCEWKMNKAFNDNPYELNTREKVFALVQSFGKKQIGREVRIINPESDTRTTLVFEDWSACIRCGETLKSLGVFSVVSNMSCQSNNEDYGGNSVICLFWSDQT